MHLFCRNVNLYPCFILADDVIVYGGPSSHRVLPSSFRVNSSNNSEVVNGIDAQGRLNPDNRLLDSDERAVYQEALQVSIFGPLIYICCLLPAS